MAYLVVVVLITAPLSFGLFRLRLAKLRLISASFSAVCKEEHAKWEINESIFMVYVDYFQKFQGEFFHVQEVKDIRRPT